MGESMRMTSAEAAKLLRKLNEELDNVLLMEQQSRERLLQRGEGPLKRQPFSIY